MTSNYKGISVPITAPSAAHGTTRGFHAKTTTRKEIPVPMGTLREVSASDSSATASVEAQLYNNGNHAAHCEQIRISSSALEKFMYWHNGWDVIEASANFDLNVSAILKESTNLPLLLHNLSWEACNQVLVIHTLKPVSSQQIAVSTSRISGATNIRTEFIGSLPKRHIHIECLDGREFTIDIQLDLRHRKEYEKALNRLPTGEAPSIFLPAA